MVARKQEPPPTRAAVRARLAARLEREVAALDVEVVAATEKLDALQLRRSELRASLARLWAMEGRGKTKIA